MLILTRHFGERIMIGDNIIVTIIKMEGKKVSLGIEAPKSVDIYREEIFNRMQENGELHIDPFQQELNKAPSV